MHVHTYIVLYLLALLFPSSYSGLYKECTENVVAILDEIEPPAVADISDSVSAEHDIDGEEAVALALEVSIGNTLSAFSFVNNRWIDNRIVKLNLPLLFVCWCACACVLFVRQ